MQQCAFEVIICHPPFKTKKTVLVLETGESQVTVPCKNEGLARSVLCLVTASCALFNLGSCTTDHYYSFL